MPNPDPTDTGAWDRNAAQSEAEITADLEAEAKRPDLKRQAQEWANLNVDPEAELFVFVGRWSMQKGVDLIADVFPVCCSLPPTDILLTSTVHSSGVPQDATHHGWTCHRSLR